MAKKKAVAGRGKKTCPKCGNIVGVRTKKCSCKHEFAFKSMSRSKDEKKSRGSEQSSLKNELVAEKKRLEEVLKSRAQMEQRLAKINALLETWDK